MSKLLAQPVRPSDYSACVAGEISRASTFVLGAKQLAARVFFFVNEYMIAHTYLHTYMESSWIAGNFDPHSLENPASYTGYVFTFLTLSLDSSQVSFNSELA